MIGVNSRYHGRRPNLSATGYAHQEIVVASRCLDQVANFDVIYVFHAIATAPRRRITSSGPKLPRRSPHLLRAS
ncbi:hypothetical protein FHT28_005860 [Rhizobium sp. SG570]|nr:hypothetical protein [Rhizobium sp. SG570]